MTINWDKLTPKQYDDLSDLEKSVLLAKAMGWIIQFIRNANYPSEDAYILRDERDKQIRSMKVGKLKISYDDAWTKLVPDLYDTANMALAWRVAQWATDAFDYGIGSDFHEWFVDQSYYLICEDPADAQRAWLDKILELAIEAGIIELETT